MENKKVQFSTRPRLKEAVDKKQKSILLLRAQAIVLDGLRSIEQDIQQHLKESEKDLN
jgi:hypothetical protein